MWRPFFPWIFQVEKLGLVPHCPGKVNGLLLLLLLSEKEQLIIWCRVSGCGCGSCWRPFCLHCVSVHSSLESGPKNEGRTSLSATLYCLLCIKPFYGEVVCLTACSWSSVGEGAEIPSAPKWTTTAYTRIGCSHCLWTRVPIYLFILLIWLFDSPHLGFACSFVSTENITKGLYFSSAPSLLQRNWTL